MSKDTRPIYANSNTIIQEEYSDLMKVVRIIQQNYCKNNGSTKNADGYYTWTKKPVKMLMRHFLSAIHITCKDLYTTFAPIMNNYCTTHYDINKDFCSIDSATEGSYVFGNLVPTDQGNILTLDTYTEKLRRIYESKITKVTISEVKPLHASFLVLPHNLTVLKLVNKFDQAIGPGTLPASLLDIYLTCFRYQYHMPPNLRKLTWNLRGDSPAMMHIQSQNIRLRYWTEYIILGLTDNLIELYLYETLLGNQKMKAKKRLFADTGDLVLKEEKEEEEEKVLYLPSRLQILEYNYRGLKKTLYRAVGPDFTVLPTSLRSLSIKIGIRYREGITLTQFCGTVNLGYCNFPNLESLTLKCFVVGLDSMKENSRGLTKLKCFSCTQSSVRAPLYSFIQCPMLEEVIIMGYSGNEIVDICAAAKSYQASCNSTRYCRTIKLGLPISNPSCSKVLSFPNTTKNILLINLEGNPKYHTLGLGSHPPYVDEDGTLTAWPKFEWPKWLENVTFMYFTPIAMCLNTLPPGLRRVNMWTCLVLFEPSDIGKHIIFGRDLLKEMMEQPKQENGYVHPSFNTDRNVQSGSYLRFSCDHPFADDERDWYNTIRRLTGLKTSSYLANVKFTDVRNPFSEQYYADTTVDYRTLSLTIEKEI